MINFAHAKGHPSCAYGGAMKNIALGCMVGPTRGEMHDTCHFDPYWFPELLKDKKDFKRSSNLVLMRPSQKIKKNQGTCIFMWNPATSVVAV